MHPTLDQLPFDILFCVAANLSLEDIVHLSQTCQQLSALMDERTVCRSIIEVDFPYTEEAKLARTEKITYKQAVRAIYDRRNALSTAYPFSARTWGNGNAFVYGQGILCVLESKTVHLSDLRSQSHDIHIDLTVFAGPILGPPFPVPGNFDVDLLNYADRILAVHLKKEGESDGGYIIALNMARNCPDDKRLVQMVRLPSSSKLFVRHTADFLYYGTHTGRGSDGHHKWEIGGVRLNNSIKIQDGAKRLVLDNFHGSDIGSTVAFEIHNGHFYAVSNQTTFEVEEIDYTSFYHVARFPLHSPLPASVERDERLYRRQHKQGPIHDSWTDLTLQSDESTNEMVIVESRREWAEASSRQSRTFYVTRLEFGSENDTMDISDELLLPEDDIYLPVIDSSNRPQWKPTPDLFSWSQHPEFCGTDPAPRSFMLARTKFRAYSYACTTFMDLVEDQECCNDASKPPCLRLRIGSRRETGLDDNATVNRKGKAAAVYSTKPNFVDNQTHYRQSPIRMWPPRASRCPCSQHLHNILNPAIPSSGASYTRSVTGVLDEQRLVFMIKSGRSYGPSDNNTLGTVVIVDFARPTKSSNSANSAPMARSDSKMEETLSLGWEWQPGLEQMCKDRTCCKTSHGGLGGTANGRGARLKGF
ncbi:hypothetical protein COCCADRAFT_90432 [Bipolaris zeicola 26-R-13]|uniref:F-box domain-containing protein n=1 Tax=Cochliobolus carbonum (strain 26-R-13) TaxID=930089 RepID=W6YD73_COCC2|nr:uncharacterized protein COCCADRAFT_90432 [Bipolaris zeicola 26-R-13]EUC35588.1 hypothetical protein COCCADRAFT_90432 [Bipolaris zeicola 26-R-13]